MPMTEPAGSPLEAGASAALPQSGATGSPQSGANIQALLQILKQASAGGGGGFSGPTTTAQSGIPSYQPRPAPVMNAPQVPQGTFQSIGEAKRANKQAMLNNIATIGNQISQLHNQRQTREMTQLVERIQGATEGKQQAEAMLKQDPNNADAKAQLQKNSQILQDIGADPKNGKKLQKAFNVDLIGDKGKMTPEYQGLMQAIKNKDKEGQQKAGAAMMQRFQNQFPSTQQISPQAQVQMALTKAGIVPKAGEQLTSQTDMLKNIINYSKELDTNASREKIAQMLVDQKDRGLSNDLIKISMQVNGRQQTAGIIATAAVKRAQIMASASMTDTQWRMAGGILEKELQTNTNNKQVGQLKGEYDTVNKELKNLQIDINNLSWTDRKGINDKTQQIQQLRQRQGRIVQKLDSLGYAGSGNTDIGPGSTSGQQNEGSDSFDRIFEELLGESRTSSEDDSK
jgi:hypothetical protein